MSCFGEVSGLTLNLVRGYAFAFEDNDWALEILLYLTFIVWTQSLATKVGRQRLPLYFRTAGGEIPVNLACTR